MMLDYFWKQQDDIPAGMGYPLFGMTHLISVAVTLVLVAMLVAMLVRALLVARRDGGFESEKNRDKEHSSRSQNQHASRRHYILKVIPVIMFLMEIFKDAFLIRVHRFGPYYLPLHICSFGIFVFLLREWLPWKWAKDFFGEIAFIVIMPASVAALIFADWTIYYPVLNFMNLYSYAWHGLLVAYPLTIYLSKELSPSIKHIHYNLLFLGVVTPFVYVFDKKYDCNFFFINWPLPGTPLGWLAGFMGNPGYLVGYAVLVVVVILLMYAGVAVTGDRRCGER
ncbi:YwaF family protein [Butyrivibrio proteoclasticus]|uniref:YwaF family protein n=1 Tax=Butyrivibrio proteoclasticus TaxID=43305 RepID=UPI0012DD9E63|nr:YwaF family protein [Butyrivibrio proteoclasticus]